MCWLGFFLQMAEDDAKTWLTEGAVTIVPCKQGCALWWDLDKTTDKGSSQQSVRTSSVFHLNLSLLSLACLSYLGVGRELGHAGFQGREKCLLFPLCWRDWASLLPHLISELGNEVSAIAVFVTGEERMIKRTWCNALMNSKIIFSLLSFSFLLAWHGPAVPIC